MPIYKTYAILAVLAAPALAAAEQFECLTGTCDNGMQLLQTTLSLQPDPKDGKEALPELMPMARSLTSPDPEAAAEHMVKYYGGRRIEANISKQFGGQSCVQAIGVELARPDGVDKWPLDKYLVYFIKDDRKWAGLMPRDSWERASDNSYNKMVNSGEESGWRAWMDFHDGHTPAAGWLHGTKNIEAIRKDKVPIQCFGGGVAMSDITTGRHSAAEEAATGYGFRGNLPNSSWAIEFAGVWTSWKTALSDEDNEYLNKSQFMAWGCRDLEKFEPEFDPYSLLWKKATYMVDGDHLQATYDFANEALGLNAMAPAYTAKNESCVEAMWSRVPGPALFEFHFVRATPPFPDDSASLFHEYVKSIRDLRSGCFDHYLYNSLVLWTDDLDPYVRRLQQMSASFLALKLQDDLFSIVFSIPTSEAIVLDIRSSKLSAVEPQDFDVCEETQCGL